MNIHLSDLWTWQGSIKRSAYLFWGVVLGAIKYNIDRLLVWNWSGQRWSLLDYIIHKIHLRVLRHVKQLSEEA